MLKPVLALAAGLALSFTALAAQAADVLKVSAIPDEAPTELLRKFQESLGEHHSPQEGGWQQKLKNFSLNGLKVKMLKSKERNQA